MDEASASTRVDEDALVKFVRSAHLHGWPDGLEPSSTPELHGFQQVRFAEGGFEYLDLFGGATTDIGLEAVFWQGELVWGASYRGGVIADLERRTDLFAFLIAALEARPREALPIRGPARFTSEDGAWSYEHNFSGLFTSFISLEHISLNERLLYERTTVGGWCGDECSYGAPLALEIGRSA